MLGLFCVGTLAAIGLLSILWAMLGWLLPAGEGAVLVCMGLPDEGILSRYRWLWDLGVLRCPMVVVTEEQVQIQSNDFEICSREELLPRLEQERKEYNGTGNGDSSGRHQRCDISEL